MPDSDQRVEAYGVWDSSEMDGDKDPDVWLTYYDGDTWNISGGLYGYCWVKNVTHWRPLPTKPQPPTKE